MRTLLAAAVVALALASAPAHARPVIGQYVALGDSIAAGGDFTDITGPLGCLRSRQNYPSHIAAALGPTTFVDNTCTGASTAHLGTAQPLGIGNNPPQFDGLSTETDLVTVTIGLYDLDPLRTLGPCLAPSLLEMRLTPPIGNPCEQQFTSTGVDTLATRIDTEVRAAVAAALQGIRSRAPHATIIALGYPAWLPPTTEQCGYWHGMARADVPYLHRALRGLSTILVEEAARVDAIGINTYDIPGHDFCQTHDARWVESLTTTEPTLPFQTNKLGARGLADLVLKLLRD
ncbi:SGNH/GDSL hydrolase family protein [Nocardia sp. NPDC050406]|uniref:SGNH/GDSL hydrolase family protein n=1 Tax=Nocardia sp. NPDC050406 TaxID=3364318 RepID=UPI00378E534A